MVHNLCGQIEEQMVKKTLSKYSSLNASIESFLVHFVTWALNLFPTHKMRIPFMILSIGKFRTENMATSSQECDRILI